MFFRKKNLVLVSFLMALSIFAILGLFWGCGLPNPFEKNKPATPVISGYSDGKKIFFSVAGHYTAEELPNFSGIDIYLGNNNDLNEIKKRLLYISKKDSSPSYHVNLYTEGFPVNIEFSEPFQFRLTTDAKELDLSDEGVDSTDELIMAKDNWTILPGKSFYFAAIAVTKQEKSAISQVLEINIPIEETANIKYGTEYEISAGDTSEEKIKVTFSAPNSGQKVKFAQASTSPTTTVQVESLSMVSDKNWQEIQLPSKNFSQKEHVYGENYIIFAQLKKNNKINFYVKILVEAVNASDVKILIHKFNKN